MNARGVLLLVVLAAASLVLATRREAASPRPAAASPASTPVTEPRRVPEPAVDPEAVRDLFRFVESAGTEAPTSARPPVVAAASSPGPEAPRLVGIVRREGRLLAAIAIDGDVALLGAGDSEGGLTVLEVTEEHVRIRRRDGAEESLALP